jgi:hypothetical protein
MTFVRSPRSPRLRVRFHRMGACRVCRPAGAGDPYSRGTHGSRRGLLSFGPPGLKRPGTRFGVPVGPRRGNSHHAVLRPCYPSLRSNHAVGERTMTRVETQGRGERGPFGHTHRVTHRHPDFPFPVFLSARYLLHGSGPAAVADQIASDLCSEVATTAMRLVRALRANPGLSSFLGHPWARGLNTVGVGKARTQRRERSACPLGVLGVSA